MRAAQAKDYGPIDEMISVQENINIPRLSSLPSKKRPNFLQIRTLAVSTACGDCRTLSGKTAELQGPPSFPYVPCGDVCGIVTDVNADTEDYFKVGDRVAARFVDFPRGALAEYAVIHKGVCDIVPKNISDEDAAALIGASPAVLLSKRIKKGERVLVFGANGGVGRHLCQLIKKVQGASYVAGVTCNPKAQELLSEPVGLDQVMNYEKEDIWSNKEWKENPFDVVVDLASGSWLQLLQNAKKKSFIVKPASKGGRFLTLTADVANFELHSIPAVLKMFMLVPIWRALRSRIWSRSKLPAYTFAMSLDTKKEVATETMNLANDGKLKACVDEVFPFTTAGVRDAFRRQESRHANGKVVIRVASLSS